MTDSEWEDHLMTTERDDLIALLDKHRNFLRYTVTGLSDEQARARTTVSELCLGGLLKHVAAVEENWAGFIVNGPDMSPVDESAYATHLASFRLEPGESLASVLDRYDSVAKHTNDLVRSVPSLDDDQPLPPRPWFEPGARWTARHVFMHILAETAQHAGHADILREAIDGQKTMG
jgi:hypothetical protein